MNRLRRTLIAAPFALAALALPAVGQEIPLAQISAYLNGLQTVDGQFTQINGDGTLATGRIYIKRPGRIRFEYDPPEEALVMAGGGQLAIFDPRSNTGPDRYPLNQTPLNILLQRNVDLDNSQMVTGHVYDGLTTTLTAQDPEHPEYGSIRLVFTSNPVELRQWIIADSGGGETTVILGEVAVGGTIRESLFNIQSEMRRRGF